MGSRFAVYMPLLEGPTQPEPEDEPDTQISGEAQVKGKRQD